jgi:serine/threonine-protein kinase
MADTTEDRESIVGAVLARRYRLTRKLGEGGMGTVYVGQSLTDGSNYAVKVLHPEYVSEPTVRERFVAEGRAYARLRHENVVRVFDSALAEDGTPFLVMELLEGVPLSAYTKEGGRIPPPQAVSILLSVLAALAMAHGQGIVHRDLKPDNVFLARSPEGHFTVKLLDFGIAKVMDSAGGFSARTKTGVLLGTPAYMSPEQVQNAKDVDHRTDLWSAGVLLYEMLLGIPAFPAPTEFAKLTAVLTQEPEPAARVDPSVAAFGPFLAKAMAKNREERFRSASEMADALAAVARTLRADAGRTAPPIAHLPKAISRSDPTRAWVPRPTTGAAAIRERVDAPSAEANSAEAVRAEDGLAITPGGTLQSAPTKLPEPKPTVPPVRFVAPGAGDEGATSGAGAVSRFGVGADGARGVPLVLAMGVAVLMLALGFVVGRLTAP